MKSVLVLLVCLFVLNIGEARAERASLVATKAAVVVVVQSAKATYVAAKQTVKAAKAVPPAVPKLPRFSWQGLKWLVKHV